MRVKPFFNGGDHLAGGGLTHIVDEPGLGETFGFGQVTKHFQAFDLHNLLPPNWFVGGAGILEHKTLLIGFLRF